MYEELVVLILLLRYHLNLVCALFEFDIPTSSLIYENVFIIYYMYVLSQSSLCSSIFSCADIIPQEFSWVWR